MRYSTAAPAGTQGSVGSTECDFGDQQCFSKLRHKMVQPRDVRRGRRVDRGLV